MVTIVWIKLSIHSNAYLVSSTQKKFVELPRLVLERRK